MGIRRASIQTTADSTVSFQAIQPQTGGYSGTSVTSIVYTDNNYNTISANAANVTYGNFRILGAGFISSSNVLIQNTSSGLSNIITSNTTFIGSGEIRANVSASIGSNYNLYVYNSIGTAGYIGGLNFEPTPYFTGNTVSFTGQNTSGSVNNVTMNVYPIAVSNALPNTITFALASGNTLPSGLTLYSNGAILGNLVWSGSATSQTWSANVIVFNAYNQTATSNIALVISTQIPYNTFTGFSLPTQLPVAVSSANLGGMAYSPSLGLYLTAYYHSSSTSSDSVTWNTPGTLASGNQNIMTSVWNSITNQFVAFGYDAGNNHTFLTTSTNGTSWSPANYIITSQTFGPLRVIFNASANSYCLIGTSQTGNINGYIYAAYSSDGGVTWSVSSSIVSSSSSDYFTDFDYSPTQGKYVMVMYNYSANWTDFATSTNGITWTEGTIGISGNYIVSGVAWMPAYNQWMMLTHSNTNSYAYFYLSTDGSTWTGPTQLTGPTTYYGKLYSTLKGEVIAICPFNTSFGYTKYNGTNFNAMTTFSGTTIANQLFPLSCVNTPTGNVIFMVGDASSNGKTYLFRSY
jgi:hypothetical protein